MRGSEERLLAVDIYQIAIQIAERIFSSSSLQFALILKEAADQQESIHAEGGKPEYSRWNKCQGIPENEHSISARTKFENVLSILKEIGYEKSIHAAEALISLARLVKLPKDPVSRFAQQMDTKHALDLQFTYLAEAINCYELNLGFDHPETGDAYSKIAMAYKEVGRFVAASPWIRRAFTIFYKTFGPHDPLSQATYE